MYENEELMEIESTETEVNEDVETTEEENKNFAAAAAPIALGAMALYGAYKLTTGVVIPGAKKVGKAIKSVLPFGKKTEPVKVEEEETAEDEETRLNSK